MTYENIIVEIGEGIATITFNRPKALNALNSATMKELDSALQALQEDEPPRVLILTGAGKAFMAGADITEFKDISPEKAERISRRGQGLFDRIAEFPAPVIAAVNGFALGGGCELVMACDFIYASDQAKFGHPEVKLGLIPGFGGTQRLARLIGPAHAKELIFTGRMIDAQEALRLGLVNAIVPQDELMARVREVAREIAAQAPLAIHYAKSIIEDAQSRELELGLDAEAVQFGRCFATKDLREGVTAFMEKRTPKFNGD